MARGIRNTPRETDWETKEHYHRRLSWAFSKKKFKSDIIFLAAKWKWIYSGIQLCFIYLTYCPGKTCFHSNSRIFFLENLEFIQTLL